MDKSNGGERAQELREQERGYPAETASKLADKTRGLNAREDLDGRDESKTL